MPKKREDLGEVVSKYTHDFLSFFLSSVEEGAEGVLKKFKNWANFKKRIKKLAIFLVIVIIALVTLADGISLLIQSLFPGLMPGVVHIVVSLALILFAFIYKESN